MEQVIIQCLKYTICMLLYKYCYKNITCIMHSVQLPFVSKCVEAISLFIQKNILDAQTEEVSHHSIVLLFS